jgi:hypothetical protein
MPLIRRTGGAASRSAYERAPEIAPTRRNAPLLRRMQNCNFREVRRVARIHRKRLR